MWSLLKVYLRWIVSHLDTCAHVNSVFGCWQITRALSFRMTPSLLCWWSTIFPPTSPTPSRTSPLTVPAQTTCQGWCWTPWGWHQDRAPSLPPAPELRSLRRVTLSALRPWSVALAPKLWQPTESVWALPAVTPRQAGQQMCTLPWSRHASPLPTEADVEWGCLL